jgi:hypothetical protein
VREQDAAQSHASEKNRDDRQKHSAVVSRIRIQALAVACPKVPSRAGPWRISFTGNANMKTRTNGQRSGFAVWWRRLKN